MKRTWASGALVAMAVGICGTARAQVIFDAVRSGDTAAVHRLLPPTRPSSAARTGRSTRCWSGR